MIPHRCKPDRFRPATFIFFLVVLGLGVGCGGGSAPEETQKAPATSSETVSSPEVVPAVVVKAPSTEIDPSAPSVPNSSTTEKPAESRSSEDAALVAAKQAVMAAKDGNLMEGMSAGMQALIQQAQATEAELRQLNAGMQVAQQRALTNAMVVEARQSLEDSIEQVITEKNPELAEKWKRLRQLGSELEKNPELQGNPDPSKISESTKKNIQEVQALSQDLQQVQQVLVDAELIKEKQKAFMVSMESAMKEMDPGFDQKIAKQQELVRRMQDLQQSFAQQQGAMIQGQAPSVPDAPKAPQPAVPQAPAVPKKP